MPDLDARHIVRLEQPRVHACPVGRVVDRNAMGGAAAMLAEMQPDEGFGHARMDVAADPVAHHFNLGPLEIAPGRAVLDA